MLFRFCNWARCSVMVLTLGAVALTSHGDAYQDALERAGDNRAELERFVLSAEQDHGAFGKRAAHFLVSYMPEKDLLSLSESFLRENLEFALKARTEFPWGASVPEELFLNDVLPYASLDESRERWRPRLYELGRSIVAREKSISDAVQALNRELFNEINVHYNTGRKRPNQSPGESIDQGRATCTGLSIILVDACRAVGIPARVTGTPLWTNNRGNHTWTEIWDKEWYFTGSDEYDSKGLNRGWFVGAAAKADKSDPKYSIYSSSWKPADANFPMVWSRRDQSVHAFNVTDRYTRDGKGPEKKNELFVRVRENKGGERIEVRAELLDELNQVVSGVMTKAGRADMNDIAALSCRPDSTVWLRLSKGDETKRVPIRRTGEASATLDLAWDALPDVDSTERSQLAGLEGWLAVPAQLRPQDIPVSALKGTLSKQDAAKATQRLWTELVERESKARQAELDAKVITLGEHSLKFEAREFGDAPEGGHSLWISMHGGGGAPAQVNDRQWKNQIGLYEPSEGIYIAPRAPTDTWNLWHQAHIDPLFQRLIENYVICRGVNPDRVYIMGYSAGGDGVFQLAPRMADRWAAAAMMAGHPNETKPDGLRNIGFALFMGGADAAYGRNKKAAEWRDQLAALRQADPEGYPHFVKIYPDTGHWMNRRDREALPWMLGFTRDAWPSRIEWLQDDVTHERFYWLELPKNQVEARQRISAWIDGQSIHVQSSELNALNLLLSDELLDLDQALVVRVNERIVFEGKAKRSVTEIRRSLMNRADLQSAATARLELRW